MGLCLFIIFGFARKYFLAAYAKHQAAEQAEKEMRLTFPDSCQDEEKAFSGQIF